MKKLILNEEEWQRMKDILLRAVQEAVHESTEAYRIAEDWNEDAERARQLLEKIDDAKVVLE